MCHQPGTHAFTMIELLVVVGILSLLLSMLMPLLRLVDRAARGSASQSVMAKVDGAARLFRAEIGSYPFQRSYADLAAASGPMPNWSNRLAYHLGTVIDPADLTKVQADADQAAAHYEFDWTLGAPDGFSYQPYDFRSDGAGIRAYPIMGNRMAAERARLMIFAGNVEARGPVMLPKSSGAWTRRTLPTGPLVAQPAQSDAKPGWAGDYLAGELEKRYVAGEAVLDGWQRPLIYVCQVVEGMTSAYVDHIYDHPMESFNVSEYGLNPLGRRTLGPRDFLTGAPLAAVPPSLPDAGQLRHSDRRTWAAPGHETDFELWSAGADGRADWMRDAVANRDNVGGLPYDKRLP